uniref:DC1 domain-containing protein n=1 Tax=Fagus sylvatica TaxID=28930 RepID=A0A2N9FTB1_FAGSY
MADSWYFHLGAKVPTFTGDKKKLPYFIHEHPLVYRYVSDPSICNGCGEGIQRFYYRCEDCSIDFLLHESCFEQLSQEYLHHPIDSKHPLILQKIQPYDKGTCTCNFCGDPCKGCDHKCDFTLDVPCSLLSDMLTHVGHEHPLILSSTTNAEKCSACKSESKIFRCTKCEFTLDFGCATLPHTVWYKQHEHPFTLRYTAEDDSGEYYCDICEEERDPKLWFYYCEECSYPAHPKCIFGWILSESNAGDFRNIKFGNRPHVQQHILARDGDGHGENEICLFVFHHRKPVIFFATAGSSSNRSPWPSPLSLPPPESFSFQFSLLPLLSLVDLRLWAHHLLVLAASG